MEELLLMALEICGAGAKAPADATRIATMIDLMVNDFGLGCSKCAGNVGYGLAVLLNRYLLKSST